MDILLLVTPSFNLAATMAFVDPFRAANYLEGRSIYHWKLASVAGGHCLASNGLTMQTASLQELQHEHFDLAMVSSSWTPELHSSTQLHSVLQRLARQGCTLGALDTGAFILARAGLLKGYRATVHYEHIDAMAELFPEVEVSEDLFVIDKKRLSCCGGSASTDLALQLIRGDQGDALANAAARYVFHPSLRPNGSPQNPGPIEPLGKTAPAAVRHAIAVMEQNLEEPVSIPDICSRIGLSHRQLDRLFATYVRKTPAAYYRDIRLDRARGLVTQTDMALSEIAVACGFAGQVHFSRAYREKFGLPPRSDRIEGRVPFEYRAWPMYGKPGKDANLTARQDRDQLIPGCPEKSN